MLFLVASSALAQPVVTEYANDFQSYKTQSNVPGWADTSIGSSKPDAQGLYKTWPDPLNKDNVVYGTKQSSGKPGGKNPRIGTFSTLTDRAFAGKGRFEYRGRFLRTGADSRIGLSFFSSYPETDRYYLIGLWPQESSQALTMQLFAFGGGAPGATIDSNFTPLVDQWTRFFIQVDDVDGETRIRARFWPDGSSEPEAFSINSVDTSPSRLTAGRIGIWAAVKGDAYVDDLHAKAPIDTTPPAIRFTGFTDGAVIATPAVRVGGEADDAVAVTVNGVPATIDAETKIFRSSEIRLLEGANGISATGADEVGNRLTIVLHLVLDTRAPEIAIASPLPGACLDTQSLSIAGSVSEPHLQSIRVRDGASSVDAAVDAAARTWAATLRAEEGDHTIVVEGLDALGHRAIVPLSAIVDRTPPSVEIATADGPAADGTIANRALSFFVTVRDLDRDPDIQIRLGSEPYASGTPVSAEGPHTLSVAATDCASHRTERAVAFTIDTTAPRFETFTPASGGRVGATPSAVTGTIDADVVSISVVGTAIAVAPANGGFTLPGLTFVEGENRFLLRAADRAGNVAETEYRLTIQTRAPSIEILESGAPIADGALFNREIHPEIRVSDPDASVTVSVDGTPFASGTAVGADGAHALAVTATDGLGHAASSQVTFTIDRTPPAVAITAPQPGRVTGGTVLVQGTADDSVAVTVNGVPAALASGAFSATVPIEEGDNVLVALGRDAAGNSGRAEVVVARDSRATGILITSPADGFLTNRASVRAAGRVLDPASVAGVTVAGVPVTLDAAGAFELPAFPLAEGENAIVAVATSKNGGTRTASVRVVADRTPPALRVLESGQSLSDQARFAESAALSIDASDERGLRSSEARLDGSAIALPMTVAAAGGHTIVAVAIDAAGNETRLERTFFIGAAGSAGGCRLDVFHPPSGSVVALATTGLTGRTGGAAGVKINGVPASVANGSFCATLELPAEGANQVEIVCTDAGGNPTGTPATITLVRSTATPSVWIDAPAEGSAVVDETVRVTGTAGAGVVDVTVNGAAAAIASGDPNAPRAFSLDGVRLVSGWNVLLVRAKTAAGRSALATRRVLYLDAAPSLTITSPLPAQEVGSALVALSGLWSGIDPATLAAAGSAASPEIVWSGDRSGSFLFRDLPLTPGDNALTISGSDVRGRVATATVSVRRDDLAPFIQTTAPRDHAVFGSASPALEVSGTAIAANGATIEVGGQPATIVSSEATSETRTRWTFSASASFAAVGPTPVVARVTEPSGRASYHAIRVTKLSAAPKIDQVFPAAQAIGVDPGAMVVVLFTSPMGRASLRCGAGEGCAFRLESASGSAVSGLLDVDEDALTFAPAAPLEDGVEYTIRISTTAKDAGGVPLAGEYVSRFRVGLAAAPSAAPVLDALPAKHCGSTLAIAGSAPAGARVQLDVGSSKFTVAADASGRFAYAAPLTGESGYVLVRARTIASDGSLSAASHSCVLVDCGGLGVSAAAFNRTVNILTITFTAPVDLATATTGDAGSIRLRLADSQIVGGTVALSTPSTLLVTPSEDLRESSFTLEVTTAIRGADGAPLSSPFSQPFLYESGEPAPGDGTGFISGEVYDASTGRPLASARIAIAAPTNAFGDIAEIAATTSSPLPRGTRPRSAIVFGGEGQGVRGESTAEILSDSRGRYTLRLPEGAHTLYITAQGYTSAWRQVILPAGAGITPIDIRIAKRAETTTVAALPLTLTHGGDDAVTARATLEVPSGGIASGAAVTFTSVGAQSLAGLLPLGWSPLGSAELVTGGGELAAATLSFDVPAAGVTASGKTLSLVRYDATRDEWRVIVAVVNVVSGRAVAPIAGAGTYALVYADAATAPSLAPGAALPAAPDPCATSPCGPMTKVSFALEPEMVLPDGTAVATLVVNGEVPFPSGTAVQAWIDEELRLTDGTTLLDPPFAADLILYRSLDGATASALFHLSPSPRAAEVILEVGYDHVRVRPYPGRLARGTLIGSEGGRVPSDGDVVVEIPAGASPEPIRASASSLPAEDLAALGAIAGFRILGGAALELESATEPSSDGDGDGAPDPAAPVVLLAPARLTFHADPASLPAGAQVIVAEVLGDTPYGRIIRLAACAVEVPFEGDAKIFTTSAIDRSILPLDGVVREGRYLFLAAEAPIAFATGSVRRGDAGPYLEGALVTASPLGVQDITRLGGLFVVPVPAAPAQPFSVVARHGSIGEGSRRVAGTAPDKDAIVALGDLLLAAQPPQVTSTVPQNGASDVSLTTTVRVQFDRALDPSSITADAIAVSGPAGTLAGTVSADGPSAILWSLPPGSSLAPGAIHTARVSAQVRSSAGAPLGRAFSFSFATLSQMWNVGEVRPARISITIPSAGLSTIHGAAGALPSGWQAVAVRRGSDFVTRYQATADANGAFTFSAGSCGSGATSSPLPAGTLSRSATAIRGEGSGVRGQATCADAISIADLIDLHVINNAGSLAAIIPLTPFVNSEGTGFIASQHDTTTFTSKDGFKVTVLAGAFDTPVLATVTPEQKTALADVPNLDAELRWSGSVELNLDCSLAASSSAPCVANERIDLEIPVAPNTDPTGRIFLLGLLGQSVRGPRIMVVDTLRIADGKFTTAPATAQGASVVAAGSRLPTPDSRLATTVQVNADVKSFLLGVNRSGIYSVVDVNVPAGSSFGWSLMDVAGGAYDLFNSTFGSLYASSLYLTESRGRIAIPVLTGTPFKITGYDAATGLQAFEQVYDPIPLGDPGAAYAIDSPLANVQGPYPVFGMPFRIETLDVDLEGADFESIPNFTIRLEGGIIKVADAAGNALPADVAVTLLNPLNGALATRSNGLAQVPGKLGERIILLVRETNVDADTSLSVVFNEPISLGGAASAEAIDAFLKKLIRLEHRAASAPPGTPFTDATDLVRFSVDSGRRVRIDLPASLHRAAHYRVRIKKDLADEAGLKILQYKDPADPDPKGGLASDLILEFVTRAPGGSLASFDIRQDATTQLGAIRDLALEGNMMFVSALEGGLISYDVSNPGGMTSATLPLSYVSGGLDDYWSAAVDHHGRVYAAALGNTFGVIRTFRAEQFLRPPGATEPHVVQNQIAGGMVSWVPGYSSSLPMSTATVLSDRPEAIPRKVQVLVQDDEDAPLERAEFKQVWSSMISNVAPLADGAERLTMSLPIDGSQPYLLQRVTVENLTSALRASGDARPGEPAEIEIVAGARERLRIVRNLRTYGVVSLFGYGIGILDLNALESNDAPNKPSGWKPLQERIAFTRASIEPDDSLPSTWSVGEIPDLTFTPDAAILPGNGGPNVFALDARRGILDLPVRPEMSPDGVMTLGANRGNISGLVFRDTLGAEAYDHPRLAQLRAKFKALAGRDPFGRFNTIAPYSWSLSGAANTPVAPGSKYGQRGSMAGDPVRREYTFVAGNEYGLLVVEAGGDAPAGLSHEPLAAQNLVDIIWIPAGAASVRVVPGWHVAAVTDGLGHLLLVDISRIDERFGKDGAPAEPKTALFPTVSASLAAKGAYGIGTPDPRILWRSEKPVASGTLAPLVDPRTGLVYAGRLLEKRLEVIAALDPRLRVLVDLGDGVLQETGGVVPLGVLQKGTKAEKVPGAVAAFRLEIWLPGGIGDALPGGFRVAVESERVYKALAEQMPEGWPRAHLRLLRPDGTPKRFKRLGPGPKTKRLLEVGATHWASVSTAGAVGGSWTELD